MGDVVVNGSGIVVCSGLGVTPNCQNGSKNDKIPCKFAVFKICDNFVGWCSILVCATAVFFTAPPE